MKYGLAAGFLPPLPPLPVLGAALALHVAGFAVGYWIPRRLLKLDVATCRTLSLQVHPSPVASICPVSSRRVASGEI